MESPIRTLTAQLSQGEKVALLSGQDTWHTVAVERIGLPSVKVTDGPVGARGDSTTGARSVCLPAPVALAASFDLDLIHQVGRLLGRETLRKGAQVLLAPTLNVARHVLGGRNFESFGEEPNLIAAAGQAYIGGIQSESDGSRSVVACAKHLVANDVEWGRMVVSSQVDEATLREAYLVPFEAAVSVGVGTIMSAYPKLNGVYCSQNQWLLQRLLRHEWGFSGLVVSDWGATHDAVASIEAGLDLEMPGPPVAFGARLSAAVADGQLTESQLDARIEPLLQLATNTMGMGTSPVAEQTVDDPVERILVRRAATSGMVLARNRLVSGQPLLPVGPGLRSIAVIGPNADPGVGQGGGSAEVPAHYQISPLAGIRAAFPQAAVDHHPGCLAERYLPRPSPRIWSAAATGDSDHPLLLEKYPTADLTGAGYERSHRSSVFAFVHGFDDDLPDPAVWSWRWRGRLPIVTTGKHRFGVLAVGPSRVLVDGELVVDNWTSTVPGDGFFQRASAEKISSIDLEAGSEVEVVVEWSRGDDEHLAGLRFGYQPPTDEDGMVNDAVELAGRADLAVVVAGLNAEWETESQDRVDFALPGRQNELITRVSEANPNTVVVVNAGSAVDLPWLDQVPATLLAWYPGQEFGHALGEILTGAAEPGGRLPLTVPRSLEQTPTASLVPASSTRPEPSAAGGVGPVLDYGEALFIGHRWYESRGVEPRLPFGFGLGYTRFELGEPLLEAAEVALTPEEVPAAAGCHPVVVTVPVTNVGDRAGKCVVQIYAQFTGPVSPGAGQDPATRPRVLAGFAAAEVEPGSSTEIALAIPARVFAGWHMARPEHDADGASGWRPLIGSHRLDVGLSSADRSHSVVVDVVTG